MNLNKRVIYIGLMIFIILSFLLIPIFLRWVIELDVPICIFKRITGRECWGCGMTRAFYSVMTFNFREAYEFNSRIIVVFPMVCIVFVQTVFVYVNRWIKKQRKDLILIKKEVNCMNEEDKKAEKVESNNEAKSTETTNASNSYKASKVTLGYIFSILGLIFIYNSKGENELARKHYKQAGAIFIITLVFNIAFIFLGGFIPFAGMVSNIISFLLFACCLIGAVKGYKEEDIDFPVITDLSNKMFK